MFHIATRKVSSFVLERPVLFNIELQKFSTILRKLSFLLQNSSYLIFYKQRFKFFTKNCLKSTLLFTSFQGSSCYIQSDSTLFFGKLLFLLIQNLVRFNIGASKVLCFFFGKESFQIQHCFCKIFHFLLQTLIRCNMVVVSIVLHLQFTLIVLL